MGDEAEPFDYSAFTGANRESSPPQSFGTPAGLTTRPPAESHRGGWLSSPGAVNSTAAGASRPPLAWLVVGNLSAAIALTGALALGSNPAVAAGAWFLGGPVAIALLAVFTLRDTAQRVDTFYSSGTWTPWLYRTGIGLIALAIIASALHLALWVGRQ